MKTANDICRVTFDLPVEDLRRIEQIARQRGVARSGILRAAIRAFLVTEERPAEVPPPPLDAKGWDGQDWDVIESEEEFEV